MIYLVDTNVLLRFLHRTNPHYPIAVNAVDTLKADGDLLYTTFQNLIEFWNVSTRPTTRNGFGLSIQQTNALLQVAKAAFPLLLDSQLTTTQWERLVTQYGVNGVQVHDAHLVASMLTNNVTHILTFNTTDFTRYAPEGIIAVDPASV